MCPNVKLASRCKFAAPSLEILRANSGLRNSFFRLLAPWVMFFDPQRDGDAVEMRVRSPLLFHVILLSTSYYLMGTSERGTAIYLALVDLVNELIAPILISTQGYHLNVSVPGYHAPSRWLTGFSRQTDLVRALNLLML